jgi:hypothetical protein
MDREAGMLQQESNRERDVAVGPTDEEPTKSA